MDFTHIISILLAAASIGAGAFFGALRSKLLASKTENKLHIAFYIFSILTFVTVVLVLIICWNDFVNPKANWYAFIVSFLALLFSAALFLFTKKYLIVKSIYEVKELDPIINGFTSMADKNEIKLFGGDLNFFGNAPNEMDINKQYTHLKSLNFNKVSILCEEPNDATKKIRYGKIYNEIKNVELRFYHPEKADLRVRGRIIKVNGSSKLLMYTKYLPGKYQALETDTANSGGALYDNIWELGWSMAVQPNKHQIEEYVNKYKG